MQESGIYQKLVSSYTNIKVKKSNDFLDYKTAKLAHFFGLFVICLGYLSFAFIAFLCEIIGQKIDESYKNKLFIKSTHSHVLDDKCRKIFLINEIMPLI